MIDDVLRAKLVNIAQSGVYPDSCDNASEKDHIEKANATAVLQWRSWLRGADLNRRPLGYAI